MYDGSAMIIKERTPGEHRDVGPLARAGARAEEQMAFYLRRAFADNEDILVLNDLRFHDETGDTCQIDHLIVHWYGFIFVESKSVTSGIKVNRSGEWIRYWNNIPTGMPSPVLQAKRQQDFLKRALNANAASLTGKLFGVLQKSFGGYQWDVLVAISDQGTITREVEVPELCKADQIPDRIKEKVAGYKSYARSLSMLKDPIIWMDADTRNQVLEFLLHHHDSKVAPVEQPSAAPEAPPPTPPTAPVVAPGPAVPVAALCPRCGAPLVERMAKKGANINKSFLGCSAFPKCRYASSLHA